jgi:tRNA-splicing ligase RtcB
MGRKQATRELDLDKEISMLNNKGILHSIRNTDDLDEAPSAYKDIDVVMDEQKDLVKIKVKLTPLAVIKG